MRVAAIWLVALAVASCSKKEPPPPERTEPWPAQPEASTAASVKQTYVIATRGEARIELPTKQQTPKGRLRVARGKLEVDLANLAATRGVVELDVASIEMEESGELSATDATREARNWLNVGSSRPEAERERLRWAKFEITAIEDLSASAAHAGKREKRRREANVDDAGSDAASSATPEPGEERSVTLTAKGRLTLHGFRVELGVPLRVSFQYENDAEPDAKPIAIRIETRRSFPVSLRVHDIVPRDSAGLAIAAKTSWLGTRVGRDARVSLALEAAPPR